MNNFFIGTTKRRKRSHSFGWDDTENGNLKISGNDNHFNYGPNGLELNGILRVSGNDNHVTGVNVRPRPDVFDKNKMDLDYIVKVSGNDNHVKDINVYACQPMLACYTILSVADNDNHVKNLHIFNIDASRLHNYVVQLSGNDNRITGLEVYIHDDGSGNGTHRRRSPIIEVCGNDNSIEGTIYYNSAFERADVKLKDLVSVRGCDNHTRGLSIVYTQDRYDLAEKIKPKVQDKRNFQTPSSNQCGSQYQSGAANYHFQLPAEHTRQATATSARNDQVAMATTSSRTGDASRNSSSSESAADSSQTEMEFNSQPSQGLVRELEILKTQRLCKVCFSQNAGVTFAPCGHLASCVDCCSKVDRCPVCLSIIDNIVKTFIP
ncbi:uncharacterized protein LOC106061051 isoform X1 [Biomphalaria glabrata]|uniref:Uncharacterized protein LOC106061051 isoform X1 n=1 Tax=Biomphalaria glabrata TaxID=6526 RepID=A0A9W3BH97_BIOGL|nr:uncharacterized protein LOC106061051 isoform X1 [Biomphalaria glabrata]XP_055898809.1 uncharacterized protein LOC106061051 isoform X1 [Biomphalaria glabrata]